MLTNLTKGKTLTAVRVSDNEAAGTVTLNELEHFGVKSPYNMAKIPASRIDADDQGAKELRLTVQRTWDRAREARADLYKQYLLNLYKKAIVGATPPVTLYVSHDGSDTGDGLIVFPYQASAIAIDGETQIEARYRLRAELPDTGDIPFAVVVHHGIDEQHAIQILHDYNRYAHPIPESKLGSRNSTGGLSQTIIDALSMTVSHLDLDKLNRQGNTGTKKYPASFKQAMTYVASTAVGKNALRKNAAFWFDELNQPGGLPINGSCPQHLANLLDFSVAEKTIGTSPAMLWQVAGVLGSEGINPIQLKWAEGRAAYAATGAKTAGKKKISERLQAVYDAMKP